MNNSKTLSVSGWLFTLLGQWSAGELHKYCSNSQVPLCSISSVLSNRKRGKCWGNAREMGWKPRVQLIFCSSSLKCFSSGWEGGIFPIESDVLFTIDNCLLSSLLKGLCAVSHAWCSSAQELPMTPWTVSHSFQEGCRPEKST